MSGHDRCLQEGNSVLQTFRAAALGLPVTVKSFLECTYGLRVP